MHGCTDKAKATAYSTLVRPYLEYCNVLYTTKNINLIQSVQHRAARWIKSTFDPFTYCKATPNKFSISQPPLRHICMRAGSPFPLFHYEIVSSSIHYFPNYSHWKQQNNTFSLYLHL